MLVFALTAAVLAGCAAEPPPVSEKVQQAYDNIGKATLQPSPKAITVTAIGDSVTAGNSPNFMAGQLGTLSWVSLLPSGEQFVGGWALKGATTEDMLANAKPVAADVLVIIAGTNDGGRVPFATSADHLKAIAQKVGAKRVVVSAIPPRDANPEWATDYNLQLQPFAVSQGWQFVDPMVGVRSGDHYIPGMTADGVHPTAPAVKIIAESLATAIKG